MLTVDIAKDIAGKRFIEKFGESFVNSNINKLTVGTINHGETVQVDFGIGEKEIDSYPDLFHADGIEHFPDIIYSVNISLTDGTIVND